MVTPDDANAGATVTAGAVPSLARISQPYILIEPSREYYVLDAGEFYIGRARDSADRLPPNRVVLNDATVSRRHARIERRSDGWWLTSVARKGRTRVNDQDITEVKLEDGLVVVLGNTPLTVVFPDRLLPYPLVGPRLRALSQTAYLSRLKAALEATDVALRFVAAIAACQLRDRHPDKHAALSGLLRNVPVGKITMGVWEDLSWQLARLLPEEGLDPVNLALRALCRHEKPSALARRLDAAVDLRNYHIGHAVTYDDEMYESEAAKIVQLLEDLAADLGLLSNTTLVSAVSIDPPAAPGAFFDHQLRVYRGALEQAPIDRRALSGPLLKQWCYLLLPSGSPLCLAPFIQSRFTNDRGVHELYLADEFVPRGKKISLRGVGSNHRVECDVPAPHYLLGADS